MQNFLQNLVQNISYYIETERGEVIEDDREEWSMSDKTANGMQTVKLLFRAI